MIKSVVAFCLISILIACCVSSKKIVYGFESKSIIDSITVTLKRYENQHQSPYQKVKWFALIRENLDSYEIIINEEFGDKASPLRKVIKNSNRYLFINSNFQIPIVFETDVLSIDMRKSNIGSINWGGYYFKVIKEIGEYRVSETRVLF